MTDDLVLKAQQHIDHDIVRDFILEQVQQYVDGLAASANPLLRGAAADLQAIIGKVPS